MRTNSIIGRLYRTEIPVVRTKDGGQNNPFDLQGEVEGRHGGCVGACTSRGKIVHHLPLYEPPFLRAVTRQIVLFSSAKIPTVQTWRYVEGRGGADTGGCRVPVFAQARTVATCAVMDRNGERRAATSKPRYICGPDSPRYGKGRQKSELCENAAHGGGAI